MASIKYPLDQVIKVKEDRVEEARKEVKAKQKLYDKELEAQKIVEEARQVVFNHRNDKLVQYRHALDTGTNTDEIQQMKRYLDIVKDKLKDEDAKVAKQKEKTLKAEKELELAEKNLKDRIQQVDKLKTHKEMWTKERIKEIELAEEIELDDIGSIIHLNVQNRKRQTES